MSVPSSDRVRRPFLLLLSLSLLLSALHVLLLLFLDHSPGTLAFLSSRLIGSAPSPPSPLLPQQQNPKAIMPPGTGSPPHSQLTVPLAASIAKAEENTEASQPQATTGVKGIENRNSWPQVDNNSRASTVEASGKIDTSVVAIGEEDGGGEDDKEVKVRWETRRELGRGVAAVDYIPCLGNERPIKALRSRRHMEHRKSHCPVAPWPRCLVPLPVGYRMPLPWPCSRDMVRISRSSLAFIG